MLSSTFVIVLKSLDVSFLDGPRENRKTVIVNNIF